MPCPEAMAVGVACVSGRDRVPPHAQGCCVHSTVLPSLQQQRSLRVVEEQGGAAVLSQTAPVLDTFGSPSSSSKSQAGQYDRHESALRH